MTNTEREEIKRAKEDFEKRKLVVALEPGKKIPESGIGSTAIALHIVVRTSDGRLVVVPIYPEDNAY